MSRNKMTITIEQGILEGSYFKTKLSNKPYVSFLGIPYAKPPVGNLRFKPPIKHPGWSGVLKATSDGNECLQYNNTVIANEIIGNEDCLYLNIFVPQDELHKKKAVMMFIHGGAFNFGSVSSSLFSPDYLLDENVIVVTINYRLNIFGFLNLNINECPGNMGLKDQLLALKWIRTNISAFGGDTNNITIFGESAGATSVYYHMLSPQSKGLFQRAIMQSGCDYNQWAFSENHMEETLNAIKQLGCEKDNPKEIVQYLLKIPAADLLKCTKLKKKYEVPHYHFRPSIESDAVCDKFLPVHPKILTNIATPVPLITGINNMEGLFAFTEYIMKKFEYFHEKEELHKFFDYRYSQNIIDKIKNFYFHERNLECEITKLENICHLYSDKYLIKDFHRSFNHFLKQGVTPVYNYEFKFDGDCACHGDELNYIFYGTILGLSPKVGSPELRMCRIVCKLWSNFAKTGNPNSHDLNFIWKNTSLENPNYLSLDADNTCMIDKLLCDVRVNFWKNIMSETVQLQSNL